ncbi:MAG: hypothetical protein J5933_00580 [Clostridia bacterium]|nr:hypothetical protein [Clostridia bacterium]
MITDYDKIAKKFIDGGQLFVHPSSYEERIELVEFLEKEGFKCVENNSFSRVDTLESKLPLVIELRDKMIRHMGNVTCAAAAATSRVIIGCNELYLLYSLDKAINTNASQIGG